MFKGLVSAILLVSSVHLVWLSAGVEYPHARLALESEAPIRVLDESQLTVGPIWATDTIEHHITLKNCSSRAITIRKFHTSCSCTSVNPSSITLAPAEKTNLKVTLELTSKSAPTDFEEDFSTFILPIVDDLQERVKPFEIICTIRNPFLFKSNEFQFEEDSIVAGNQYPSKNIRIAVNPEVAGLGWDVLNTDEILVVQLNPVDNSRFDFDVVITPNQHLPIGHFTSVLKLIAGDRSRHTLHPTEISISGEVCDPVSVTPRTIALGDIELGQTKEMTAVFSNRSGESIQFLSSHIDDANVAVAVLPPLQSNDFNLSFRVTPQTSESKRCRVRIDYLLTSQNSSAPTKESLFTEVSYNVSEPE